LLQDYFRTGPKGEKNLHCKQFEALQKRIQNQLSKKKEKKMFN